MESRLDQMRNKNDSVALDVFERVGDDCPAFTNDAVDYAPRQNTRCDGTSDANLSGTRETSSSTSEDLLAAQVVQNLVLEVNLWDSMENYTEDDGNNERR